VFVDGQSTMHKLALLLGLTLFCQSLGSAIIKSELGVDEKNDKLKGEKLIIPSDDTQEAAS